MSSIPSINNTDETLKELCKQFYKILCDHDLWLVFLRLLRNAKKYGDYRLIVTDGHFFNLISWEINNEVDFVDGAFLCYHELSRSDDSR